jgi:hypothetical protein
LRPSIAADAATAQVNVLVSATPDALVKVTVVVVPAVIVLVVLLPELVAPEIVRDRPTMSAVNGAVVSVSVQTEPTIEMDFEPPAELTVATPPQLEPAQVHPAVRCRLIQARIRLALWSCCVVWLAGT